MPADIIDLLSRNPGMGSGGEPTCEQAVLLQVILVAVGHCFGNVKSGNNRRRVEDISFEVWGCLGAASRWPCLEPLYGSQSPAQALAAVARSLAKPQGYEALVGQLRTELGIDGD